MLALLFTFSVLSTQNNNYAIIMSGSKGYTNYRHQADVYTWITLLNKRGYDNSHIISLCYNDIQPPLYHIFNEHDNVPMYVNIDYENIEATKHNFLNILSQPEHDNITGWIWKRKEHINKFAQEFTTMNNKHINLTGLNEEDVNILVVYINHGINGFLSVPNKFDDDIYIDDLVVAINALSKHVNSIVLIIEACFSGSFVLTDKWERNVLVIAASGANQSSYSFGWSSTLKTFTTDEFTYYIVNYIDNPLHNHNTIRDMVNYVSERVRHSHILTIPNRLFNLKISDVFYTTNHTSFTTHIKQYHDVRPNINKYVDNIAITITKQLNEYYNTRNKPVANNIRLCYNDITKITKHVCYYNEINEYNLYSVYKVGLLCNEFNTLDIIKVINDVC